MKKRFFSILLILSLALSFVPVGAQVFAAEPENSMTVLYIPLDNRPFHYDRMILMAESLEMTLLMPEEDLFSTKLDGQEPNANGTQYGDRALLLQFLMDYADKADVILLSLDQLLSGGLMNSRCMEEMEPIVMPNGTEYTEYDVIDMIAKLAQDKTVYVIDSVLRLATSNEFGGYVLSDYNLTRKYGMTDRLVLQGEDLTVENIIASYNLYTDGSEAYLHAGFTEEELKFFIGSSDMTVAETDQREAEISMILREDELQTVEFEEPMYASGMDSLQEAEDDQSGDGQTDDDQTEDDPPGDPADDGSTDDDPADGDPTDDDETDITPPKSLMEKYLSIRERKLRLNDYAVRTFSGMENILYLLGVDDSTEGNSIHSNEIAYISRYLDGNDQIFSALDGLAQTAMADIFSMSQLNNEWNVSVSYYGASSDQVGDFNYLSAEEMVTDAIGFYRANLTEDNPDVSVLVYLSAKDTKLQYAAIADLVGKINENEHNQIPTILIDLSDSGKTLLNQALQDGVHLGWLLSYSGKADSPVQIQMAISQGYARYCALKNFELSDKAQESHLKSLLWAYAEEYYKTNGAAEELYDYLYGLGYLQNLGMLSPDERDMIGIELTSKVFSATEGVLENFMFSNCIVSLEPYTLAAITTSEILSCEFPWHRQFEIGCVLNCTLGTEAHTYGTLHGVYINGMESGRFGPEDNLTREQAAKLLVLNSGITVDETNQCPFEDVADWAEIYVTAAYHADYMHGYSDSTFQGSQNMTRGEFAAMLGKYLEAEDIVLEMKTEVSFSDVDADAEDWYSAYVYHLAEAEIIRGYPDGTFRPDSEITRAEAVVLMNRFFQRCETLPEGLLQIPKYSDVEQGHWAYGAIQEASIIHFCYAES